MASAPADAWAATQRIVTVEMLSDWHIGTGSGGAADVDRAVKRDHDGLPYLPARSLWGIWRDACEQIALGLDGAQAGAWSTWVNWLFGSQPAQQPVSSEADHASAAPAAAALTLTAARFAPDERPYLSHPAIAPAITTVRAGVAIDRDTGTARPDHLRRIEMAPAGAVLTATLGLPAGLPDPAAALLTAGASQVTHIGGRRRRGAGRCRVAVEGWELGSAIGVLRQLGPDVAAPPQPDAPVLGTASPTVRASGGDEWFVVTVTVTAKSPIRLPARTVGNSGLSRTRIPGSTLLSLLQGTTPFPLAELLAEGALRVGQGVPVHDGVALLPAPRSLAVSKLGDPVLRDLFAGAGGPVRRLPADSSVALSDGRLMVISPGRSSEVHNTITDDQQRPTSSDGGIYSYDVHAPGSEWRSEVVISGGTVPVLAQHLAALAGPTRIGASRKDDYGSAEITVSEPRPLPIAIPPAGHTARLLLTSDALLLDEALRPDPSPGRLVAELARSVGATLVVTAALGTTVSSESWHSRWGFPRPTFALLGAGTVVEVASSDGTPLDMPAIALLGVLGVGERVAEGFGRFVTSPEVLETPVGQPVAHKYSEAVPARPIPSTPRRLSSCGIAAGRRALLTQVRLAGEEQRLPQSLDPADMGKLARSRTQVGALRSVLSAPDWSQATEAWLKGVEATDNRKDRWPPKFRTWLLEALTDRSSILDLTEPGRAWPREVVSAADSQLLPMYLGELLQALQTDGGSQ